MNISSLTEEGTTENVPPEATKEVESAKDDAVSLLHFLHWVHPYHLHHCLFRTNSGFSVSSALWRGFLAATSIFYNTCTPAEKSRDQIVDSRVRIWYKHHKRMHLSFFVSIFQVAGSIMMWEILSCHTLGPAEYLLNTTAYLSYCWPCPPLYGQCVLMATSSPIMKYDTKNKSSQTGIEHENAFTVPQWPPQSPGLNPMEHIWDVVEWGVIITNLKQLYIIMSICTKMFPKPFWVYSMK